MGHVHVRVDAAGHHDLARRVDDPLGIRIGERARRRHRRDRLAFDADIAARHALRGHHVAAADDQVQHRLPRRSSFRSRTGLCTTTPPSKRSVSRARVLRCTSRAAARRPVQLQRPDRWSTLLAQDCGQTQGMTAGGATPMKLGIYLNSQQPESDDPARRFAEMVEQVRLARSLGFDFDLGRRASRHARLPLLPAVRPAAAPRRRRRGHVDGHQRHPAARCTTPSRWRRSAPSSTSSPAASSCSASASATGPRNTRCTACPCRSASAASTRASRSSPSSGAATRSPTRAATGSSPTPPSARARMQ